MTGGWPGLFSRGRRRASCGGAAALTCCRAGCCRCGWTRCRLAERVPPTLEDALVYGSLPGIALAAERRGARRGFAGLHDAVPGGRSAGRGAGAQPGTFSRFLQLAALEAGNISHFRGIAQELGVPHTTVAGYYEILEDCLIAERIEALSESRTRKKLTKSPRYLFFDLGVRRAAADEGRRLSPRVLGALFEQFVGLELLRATRQIADPSEAPVLARPRRAGSGLDRGGRRPLAAGGSEMERRADGTGHAASANVPERVSEGARRRRGLSHAPTVQDRPQDHRRSLAGDSQPCGSLRGHHIYEKRHNLHNCRNPGATSFTPSFCSLPLSPLPNVNLT